MSVKDKQRPNFNESDAIRIAKDLFSIEGSVKEFPSYRDRNYYLQTKSGEEYVLKIATTIESRETLELQNAAMTHIGRKGIKLKCPAIVETIDGEQITYVDDSDGTPHMVRLLTFVPGTVFAEVNPHSPDIMHDLGSAIGTLSQALEDFSNPAADMDALWDMKNASTVIRQYKHMIENPIQADLIEYYLKMFEEEAVPKFDSLRTSVIHNDANDYNILVSNSPYPDLREFGLIDYGDTITSHTVFEIAVAAAYLALDKPDPIAAAAYLIGGYHEKFPLTEIELELIFCLICTRLVTSICLSTHQFKIDPDNEYIVISVDRAWIILEKLRKTNPRDATNVFRDACGLPQYPNTIKTVE